MYINECNCSTQAVLLNVKQSDWVYSETPNNNYFSVEFDVPEITSAVFETGLVKMYRVYDYGKDTAAQIEMPYVRHIEEYDEVGDVWNFYTETLDYEFQIGKATVFYTQSDFFYEIDLTMVPDPMQFRIVVMQN